MVMVMEYLAIAVLFLFILFIVVIAWLSSGGDPDEWHH